MVSVCMIAHALTLAGHAVQVDMEERFCSKVKELGCTCITISHRPALVAFHDLVLALDGEGGWSIHEVNSSLLLCSYLLCCLCMTHTS